MSCGEGTEDDARADENATCCIADGTGYLSIRRRLRSTEAGPADEGE